MNKINLQWESSEWQQYRIEFGFYKSCSFMRCENCRHYCYKEDESMCCLKFIEFLQKKLPHKTVPYLSNCAFADETNVCYRWEKNYYIENDHQSLDYVLNIKRRRY